MRVRHVVLALVMAGFVIAPLYAQVRPGDADSGTVKDVIADHADVSLAYELFGSEFGEFLSGDEPVALFVPTDEALDQIDSEEISGVELQTLFNQHTATGLASREPIEFIEWFVTLDGERVTVSVEDDAVILNDSATIVETIAATNGVVHIVDQSLGS